MSEQSVSIEDETLVRRAQEGDRQAFGQLVPRYGLVVHGLCTGFAGTAQASELAHEAFVEAWLKLSSLQEPARFAPWLRTLTLNICRMWYRQRQRRRERIIDTDIDNLPLARDAIGPGCGTGDDSASEALDALLGGLSRLSDDHQLALTLHYWQGLSYEQIAAFLDVPIGTVMSRLHRARTQLRERMESMTESDPGIGGQQDDFRAAVESEIDVLLALWEEESADPTPEAKPEHAKYRTNRGRTFSEAGKRLSLLVAGSPDMMRPVLAVMKDALTQHAALLLLRAGGPAIAVTVACAFDEAPSLRRNARRVLTGVLRPGMGQPLNEHHRKLPLRLTTTFLLDAVILSPVADRDKAALLVELLPGCKDQATLILVSHVLRALGVVAYEPLLESWRAAAGEDLATPFATALAQYESQFLAALAAELDGDSLPRQFRALEAAQIVVSLIGLNVLTGDGRNPSLERRVTGRLAPEDLDEAVLHSFSCQLADLAASDEADLSERAFALLGSLGRTEHAGVVRAGLNAPRATTRHAAVVAIRALEDRDSLPILLRLAREDEMAVRRIALQSLGQLGAVEARAVMVDALEDEAVRPQAISALGELGDEAAHAVLQDLARSPDKKAARLAASALYGGSQTARPASDLRRERLAKIRGADAQPMMQVCVVAAIRHLPEIRPYSEPEITRLIGEVCTDYSTTRRELVMGSPGLMTRDGGLYELSESGRAVWRVEHFIQQHEASSAT